MFPGTFVAALLGAATCVKLRDDYLPSQRSAMAFDLI
jgi:hypothetical protein